MAETIKLTIDGKEVEVPKGTPVIRAAIESGAAVPHYCYHPGLTIAGNCRMCLVEIEKMPKLVTSCTTPAAEGMVVHTRSDKVKEAVAGVEEFLLANHPLDCPICDQAGECRLQEYSYKHGNAAGRFREERLQFKKDVAVGPHVILDSERCIVCTRCVRFCDEITKTGELGVFQRGLHNEIGIFPGRELDNDYSGNVVDICPVGALTLKEFRFRKRVWFVRDVPSVCGSCAQGCNVNLGTSANQIWRLTPRENPQVNGWWMCDEGRLSFQGLAKERLAGAGMKEGASHAPVRLHDAAARIASALKASGGASAALASGGLTVEDLWILKRIASEGAPGLRIVVPERRRGEDDGFLIRADKTPNRRGAALLGLDIDEGGGATRSLLADAASGKVKTLLALGEDLASLPGGGPAIERLARDGTLLAVGAFVSPTTIAASLSVPSAAYGEFEGTWVNQAGRAQRVRRAVTPRAEAAPVWQILSMVAGHLGVTAGHASAAEVLREVAGSVAAFKGLSWKTLGGAGVQVDLGPNAPEPGPAPRGLEAHARVARG